MVKQYIDEIDDPERGVVLDEDAVVRLLQAERRFLTLLDRLEELEITINLDFGIVAQIAGAVTGFAWSRDYLDEKCSEIVKNGTDEECRRFLRLARNFGFAIEHMDGLFIPAPAKGEEMWLANGKQMPVARVVEWLKKYCPIHKQWHAPDEHDCRAES